MPIMGSHGPSVGGECACAFSGQLLRMSSIGGWGLQVTVAADVPAAAVEGPTEGWLSGRHGMRLKARTRSDESGDARQPMKKAASIDVPRLCLVPRDARNGDGARGAGGV